MNCSVIIPVGPGHEQLAQQALQSVMLAAQSPGPFEDIFVIVGDDTAGDKGRSAARNRMVAGPAEPWMSIFTQSDGEDMGAAFASEWLFFLDADDLMCAPELFGESAFAVMEPYADKYDAVWGSIHELHPNGEVAKRNQVGRITTYSAYVKTPAPLSCQMGHFVRRAAFPGFDEDLDVCEDIDLYLREWNTRRCIKQEKPLFLNRRGMHTWSQPQHTRTTGGRKMHTGREWSMRAEEMLKAARAELD